MQKPEKSADYQLSYLHDLENQVSAMMKLYHLKNFEFVVLICNWKFNISIFLDSLLHVGNIDKKLPSNFLLQNLFSSFFLDGQNRFAN